MPRFVSAKKTVDVNGKFERKDKNGFPADWILSPKRPGAAAVLRNGSVEITNPTKAYVGLYGRPRVCVDQDEECEFTATLRGKGTAALNAGWFRGDNDFAANMGGGKIALTEAPRTVTWRFNGGVLYAEKKVWAFQPVIFLNSAGKLIVDRIDIKVRTR